MYQELDRLQLVADIEQHQKELEAMIAELLFVSTWDTYGEYELRIGETMLQIREALRTAYTNEKVLEVPHD